MDFFSWDDLITIGGASLATGMMTEFLKDYIKIPTQILSYLTGLVLLLAATFFIKGPDVQALSLCIFNAIVVAGVASNTASLITRIGKQV